MSGNQPQTGNDTTPTQGGGFGLKRKIVGILGIVGTVWALVAFITLESPANANGALMAGVAVTSTVAAVIGAE